MSNKAAFLFWYFLSLLDVGTIIFVVGTRYLFIIIIYKNKPRFSILPLMKNNEVNNNFITTQKCVCLIILFSLVIV